MDEAAIEARTREIAGDLLARIEQRRPRAAERLQDWLLTDALQDEAFRQRMLRFVDVFAAVESTGDAEELHRLLGEYFAGDFPGIPRALRWMLRMGRDQRVPSTAVREAVRRAVLLFAERFIVAPGERSTSRLLDELTEAHRYPSFDLLGEAVLSEAEAEAYVERYLRLIQDLGRHPLSKQSTAGGLPALQISLKLSSLTYRFTPVDLDGSIERVTPRLVRIAEAARDAGVGLCVDAEQYELRDVVWGAFREVFALGGPLADWHGAGMVVQGYLRDADRHLDEVLDVARARGVPFQVRLVKGAYWDYETIHAAANRWPPPVFQQKAATDRMYEALVARLVEHAGVVFPAVASHNPRAHALAEALAEERGLPAGAVEHQTLHRTLEALSESLAERGWPSRDYVPVGDLIPGMAYLVRRILENSSQAGFLTTARAGANDVDLLASPAEVEDEPVVAPDDAPFERAPAARWHDSDFRDAFDAALAREQASPPQRFALPEGVPGLEWVDVVDPSHLDAPPIGSVEHAGPEGMAIAVARAQDALDAWGARPVEERAAILRRAADLLLERGHDFAAAIVREGGRDRAGAWAEVEEATDFLRLYAHAAGTLWEEHGEVIAPQGVVAVVPPWNFSLAIPCGMAVAALACGNTVVLKPAEHTPMIAHRLTALLHEVGVPADAVQCVPGQGSTTGRVLVEDPRVAMVAFTGSRGVGTWMHEAVALNPSSDGRPRSVMSEMGGKNPALVFADADIDEAVEGVLHSAFGHANQKCSAVSRVLVEHTIYPAFRDRLVEGARSWRAGPAEDSRTAINPVIATEAAERLAAAAERARQEGRVLLDEFGPQPGTLFHGPLIVEIDAAEALTAKTTTEELFGPILALTPFDDAEEAYRIANGTGYGLTSGLFSRSPSRIAEAAQRIEAGHLYVNRPTTAARPGVEPFGGMHFSGTGPKVGHQGYLWAFVRRTDAPPIEGDIEPEAGDASYAPCAPWTVPLDERIEVVERAAERLGASAAGEALLKAARVARSELGMPADTVAVAGQDTRMRFDYRRGPGVLRARGADAGWWLAAALLAGNGVTVVDSHALADALDALHAEGVPEDVLRRDEGGVAHFLRLASMPGVEFAAADGGPLCSLARALGPTPEGQRGLKAMLSPLDGPQPGEEGFLRRFAWPRVTAVRTLRHGADLGAGAVDPRNEG